MTEGIYFLKNDDEVVYVGKSKQCEKRILTHLRVGQKIFNTFEIMECPREDLSKTEKHYIKKFRPKYNRTIKKGEKVQVNTTINEHMYREIKIIAAELERSITDMIEEGMKYIIETYSGERHNDQLIRYFEMLEKEIGY